VVYTISGWSSSRDVISVSRGVATGNSRCIKQFAKKISAEFVAPVWKRRALQRQLSVWHSLDVVTGYANISPLDRLNRFCLIVPQAVVPNNYALFKNWCDDGGISNSKSVSIGKPARLRMNEWKCSDLKCVRKPTRSRLSLTHLKPFKVGLMQASIRSGATIHSEP